MLPQCCLHLNVSTQADTFSTTLSPQNNSFIGYFNPKKQHTLRFKAENRPNCEGGYTIECVIRDAKTNLATATLTPCFSQKSLQFTCIGRSKIISESKSPIGFRCKLTTEFIKKVAGPSIMIVIEIRHSGCNRIPSNAIVAKYELTIHFKQPPHQSHLAGVSVLETRHLSIPTQHMLPPSASSLLAQRNHPSQSTAPPEFLTPPPDPELDAWLQNNIQRLETPPMPVDQELADWADELPGAVRTQEDIAYLNTELALILQKLLNKPSLS